MNGATIRQRLLEALDVIGATAAVSRSLRAGFLSGEKDISLGQLKLDSLARMDLMVALEVDFGVVVTPTEFSRFRSLGQVAEHVEARPLRAGPARPGDRVDARADAVPTREAEPGVIRLFRRVLRACGTVAQLYKALGTLEHRLTPLALDTLGQWHESGRLMGEQVEDKYRRALTEWLQRMRALLASAGKAVPEAYAARRISPVMRLFTGPGAAAGKTLIVCFATIGGRRLMIPNAALLQSIDARRFDVLVVGDPWGTGFRAGVPLLGRTAVEVVESVAALEWLRDYAQVRTLGCSAGSYPALLMGYRLQAELIVSVVGRFPAERHVKTLFRMLLDMRNAVKRGRRPRVILAYGADRTRDRNFARIVARLTGGARMEVAIPGREAAHRIFNDMLEDRTLGRFLEMTVLAPMQAPLLAGETRTVTVRLPAAG
jgi:acyl carrier protein